MHIIQHIFFLDAWAEICLIFYFRNCKTIQFPSELIWPLWSPILLPDTWDTITVHIEARITQSKYPVLHLVTLIYSTLKFWGKKKSIIKSHKRDIIQLFSADTTMFSKNLIFFLPLKTKKKLPSKVTHNQTKLIFSVLARLPNGTCNQKSCTAKRHLMQDCVIRLGCAR